MITHFLKISWGSVAAVVFFSMLAAVMETITLAAIAPLLNSSSAGGMKLPFPFNQGAEYINQLALDDKLRLIAAVVLTATVVKNAFIYGNTFYSARLRAGIISYYRTRCMQRLMQTSLAYFNRRRASDFQQIIDNHMDSSLGMMVESIVSIQPHVFTLLVLLVYLFSMSVPLTVLSLMLAVLATGVLSVQAKMIEKKGRQVLESRYRFSQTLHNILHGMKTLRIFSRENMMKEKFQHQVEELNNVNSRLMCMQSMVSPSFEICGVFILSIILFASAWLVVKDPSVYSVLLIFILIWMRLIPAVKAINSTKAAVTARIPMLNDIHQFLAETEHHVLSNGSVVFSGLKKSIEFKNVGFSYVKEASFSLKDVNLIIPKGSKVGIVGASGSGKSTLGELLLRFYDPQEGEILVDGRPLPSIEVASWRRAVGVVSQDTFLLNDSIEANIAFADPQAPQEKIIKAAQRAHAHEFITQLPAGYQTRIGDRGVLISGGQRQRISIARAILNEPEILIFDEATSALDSESEKYIQQAIAEISQGKTVIAIAHRLATVSRFDYIIVMEQGCVVEAGAPDKLLEQNGFYKKMLSMQMNDSAASSLT